MGFMKSLGKVAVTTAGTPVRITSGQADPSKKVSVHSVFLQAISTNTGRIFVGTSSAMSKTSFVGVVAMIPAPSASAATGTLPYFETTIVPSPNGYNLADFWIDAEVSTDGVIVVGSEA